jgi:LmbE family N-acetylglucosaminyl deacetylase
LTTSYYDKDAAYNAADRVIIAPHADDEVLGCGGLLAKYPEGSTVVVLAEPDSLREKEFRYAKHILGYDQAILLDLPDGHIGNYPREATSALDHILNHTRPRELYLPFPASHQDHIAAYEAGIRSARLSMSENHWYPPVVKAYDVAVYEINLYQTGLQWNVFLSLDEADMSIKEAALSAYSSQLVSSPHPTNGVREMAAAIGLTRQVPFAEKFALVREVQ